MSSGQGAGEDREYAPQRVQGRDWKLLSSTMLERGVDMLWSSALLIAPAAASLNTLSLHLTCISAATCHRPVSLWQILPRAQSPDALTAPSFIWGCYYHFTNYNFRKTLDLFRYLARGVNFNVLVTIQGFAELIVDEVVVKPPCKSCSSRAPVYMAGLGMRSDVDWWKKSNTNKHNKLII